MDHVLIGAPNYDGTRYNAIPLIRTFRQPPPDTLVNLVEYGGSVLTYAFNSLWCTALNLRDCEVPVTHFLLMHADIMPEQADWLDTMLSEMKRVKAKVLSAVVAIKNEQGLTSTAWDTDPWNPLRFSTTELSAMTEPTWTQPDLLVNTGLLLVDMSEPWVEQICFHMRDANIKDAEGKFHPKFAPEDWEFSRQCRKLGVDVWATKAVTIDHIGKAGYSTRNVWGYPTDLAYRALKFESERPLGVPPRDQSTKAD